MEEALGLLCEVCILWCGCSLWYCEVRWGRVKLGPVLRFKNITHSHVVTGGPDTGEYLQVVRPLLPIEDLG